jgi:hypothetical protein
MAPRACSPAARLITSKGEAHVLASLLQTRLTSSIYPLSTEG